MELEVDGRSFEVEVADTLLSRMWGLSLREEGKMLFKFPRDTRAGIDMMLVNRPLHLYFFDSGKELIRCEKAEPWGLNPRTWKIYRPGTGYRYLLESFEDLELEPGAKIANEL